MRCIVVDDEALARERIRTLLQAHPDAEIAGEYESGADALRALSEIVPDLLFLDVQMPGMDGFSMLASLREEQRPAVIFVTAFDEHAIRAFDVNALDYLLKPFTAERFARALDRVRARLREQPAAYRAQLSRALKRLPVKTESGTAFLPVDAIDWAESEGNYVRVHAGKASPRVRETMDTFCARLPVEQFVRIHRSIVLNVNRLARLEPWAHGEFVAVLLDGTKLKSGRAYSAALRALIR